MPPVQRNPPTKPADSSLELADEMRSSKPAPPPLRGPPPSHRTRRQGWRFPTDGLAAASPTRADRPRQWTQRCPEPCRCARDLQEVFATTVVQPWTKGPPARVLGAPVSPAAGRAAASGTSPVYPRSLEPPVRAGCFMGVSCGAVWPRYRCGDRTWPWAALGCPRQASAGLRLRGRQRSAPAAPGLSRLVRAVRGCL